MKYENIDLNQLNTTDKEDLLLAIAEELELNNTENTDLFKTLLNDLLKTNNPVANQVMGFLH